MPTRGLGWDDEPNEYLVHLAKALKAAYEIELVIQSNRDEFVVQFEQEKWDFVVTDLVDETLPAQNQVGGVGLAQRTAARGIPTYLITKHVKLVGLQLAELPASVVVKSKSTYPSYMAMDIKADLERRGVILEKDRVMVIFGRDHHAPDAKKKLLSWLRGLGLTIDLIDENRPGEHIAAEVHRELSKSKACIALCTPDDRAMFAGGGEAEVHQPRANVLFELGVALGVMERFDRMILLRQFGQTPERQAHLPSDLLGIMTLQFDGDVTQVFPSLQRRLQALGLEVPAPPGTNPIP